MYLSFFVQVPVGFQEKLLSKGSLVCFGIETNSQHHRDPIKTDDGCWYILKTLLEDNLSESEEILLRALKEHLVNSEKVRLHPYCSGDANGQREDQVIVPIPLIKDLFMNRTCPDVAGPCCRQMHKLEQLVPGTIVQTIAMLKQRHRNGMQLLRPIVGNIYDAVYETEDFKFLYMLDL